MGLTQTSDQSRNLLKTRKRLHIEQYGRRPTKPVFTPRVPIELRQRCRHLEPPVHTTSFLHPATWPGCHLQPFSSCTLQHLSILTTGKSAVVCRIFPTARLARIRSEYIRTYVRTYVGTYVRQTYTCKLPTAILDR